MGSELELRDAVAAKATEIFGNAEDAGAWLNMAAMALDWRRPNDLLASVDGVRDVMRLLGQIEHGVYV